MHFQPSLPYQGSPASVVFGCLGVRRTLGIATPGLEGEVDAIVGIPGAVPDATAHGADILGAKSAAARNHAFLCRFGVQAALTSFGLDEADIPALVGDDPTHLPPNMEKEIAT